MELGRVQMAPGFFVVEIAVKIAQDGADAVGETRFLKMDAQLVFRDLAQDGHGVVPEVLPAAR